MRIVKRRLDRDMKESILVFLRCFYTDFRNKYHYLGYPYSPFVNATENDILFKQLIRDIDKIVKPKYIPRFVLNLAHLYGMDNSIIRIRSRRIYKLRNKLTKCVLIQDVKIKYGTLRIYGSFNEEIWKLVDDLCTIVDETLEAY